MGFTDALSMHPPIYEPLHLLIGRKPKLPAECEELPDDIELIPDFRREPSKGNFWKNWKIQNLQTLLKMRDDIFEDAG